jgi:hypothetical protein
MSFIYNSETWTPKGSNEHALDILNTINNILIGLGVSTLLTSLLSNSLWIFCLAVGAVRATLDQILYQAQQSFNISNCDDQQIMNLLPIAGTSLIIGSYSIVQITVTASSAGSCFVPEGSVLPFINGVTFITNEDLTVLASQTGTVWATSDTIGKIEVAENQLTSFQSSPENLETVTNASVAIAGKDNETVSQVRLRLEQGKVVNNNINGVMSVIKSLSGIQDCKIYINTSNTTNLTLPGDIDVLPRHAYVVILGSSDYLASTFFSRMLLETQGNETQNYITLVGQTLTLNYDNASAQNVYVKIYIPSGIILTTSQTNGIKKIITDSQSSLTIGEVVNSKFIDNLFINFLEFEISGSEISLDGNTWSQRVEVDSNNYPRFLAENIEVENLT